MSSISRKKLTIAGLLVLAVVLLFALEGSLVFGTKHETVVRYTNADLEEVLDTLFVQHGIDIRSIKRRSVKGPDKTLLRSEKTIAVASSFISVNFNRDLSEAMQLRGLTVVATEKTRESKVTMHIKDDDMIVQSITFVQQQAK